MDIRMTAHDIGRALTPDHPAFVAAVIYTCDRGDALANCANGGLGPCRLIVHRHRRGQRAKFDNSTIDCIAAIASPVEVTPSWMRVSTLNR